MCDPSNIVHESRPSHRHGGLAAPKRPREGESKCVKLGKTAFSCVRTPWRLCAEYCDNPKCTRTRCGRPTTEVQPSPRQSNLEGYVGLVAPSSRLYGTGTAQAGLSRRCVCAEESQSASKRVTPHSLASRGPGGLVQSRKSNPVQGSPTLKAVQSGECIVQSYPNQSGFNHCPHVRLRQVRGPILVVKAVSGEPLSTCSNGRHTACRNNDV